MYVDFLFSSILRRRKTTFRAKSYQNTHVELKKFVVVAGNKEKELEKQCEKVWQWERYYDVSHIYNYVIDEAQTRELSFKSQNNKNLQASDIGRSI